MAELKRVIEALLFVHARPLGLKEMVELLPEWKRAEIEEAAEELIREYEERSSSFRVERVAEGYQFRTRVEYAPWIRRLKKVRPIRLSRAALEALAIVAYRQPVSRAEIEEIRGVDSGWVIGSLMDKGLIRPVGRKSTPGRPLLYGTTKKFLEVFGLKDLKDLPTLKEVESLQEG